MLFKEAHGQSSAANERGGASWGYNTLQALMPVKRRPSADATVLVSLGHAWNAVSAAESTQFLDFQHIDE